MAVLNKDQFFDSIRKQIGTDTSDDTIHFLEDMTDTYNSLENQAVGDGVNWKQKYDELDKSWQERYRSRFFSSPTTPDYILNGESDNDTPTKVTPNNISIDDLFTVL